MGLEDILRQGSISVDEDKRFKYHIDVLRLFGKNLKAHMTATYRLDDGWRVWFPKLYTNRDFCNELIGNTFEMKQKPTSQIVSQKSFPKDEPGQRIIFGHVLDPITKKKYYKFIGVFSELTGQMGDASCQQIAKTLYFNGEGRFSTKPLTPRPKP